MRSSAIACALGVLVGCTGIIELPDGFDHEDPETLVLEGAELEAELLLSPVREAPVAFVASHGNPGRRSERILCLKDSQD